MNETEKLYQQQAYDSPEINDWIEQHSGDVLARNPKLYTTLLDLSLPSDGNE